MKLRMSGTVVIRWRSQQEGWSDYIEFRKKDGSDRSIGEREKEKTLFLESHDPNDGPRGRIGEARRILRR